MLFTPLTEGLWPTDSTRLAGGFYLQA